MIPPFRTARDMISIDTPLDLIPPWRSRPPHLPTFPSLRLQRIQPPLTALRHARTDPVHSPSGPLLLIFVHAILYVYNIRKPKSKRGMRYRRQRGRPRRN